MRFCWLVIVVSAWLVAASAARGEVEWQAGAGDTPTVIRVKLAPVARADVAPLVAAGTQDGNAAPLYRDAIRQYEAVRQKHAELTDERLAAWNDTTKPLDAASAAQIDAWLAELKPALDTALAATQMRGCDWQFGEDQLRGMDYFNVDVGIFDSLRKLSGALNLRARRATGERRFDDALRDVRGNLRMARDLAACKLLICGLIGTNIAEATVRTTLELMAAPGAPDLSAALAALPRPVIDMRPGIKFDLVSGYQIFPLIHDPETTERTPEEWNAELRRTLGRLLEIVDMEAEREHDEHWTPGHAMMAVGYSMGGYTHAKQILVRDGMPAEAVESLPVGKAIAIGAARAYRQHEESHAALLELPYQQFLSQRDALERKLDEEAAEGMRFASDQILPIAELVSSPSTVAYTAQFRLDRDFAALEVLAALRLHAGTNGGKLPAALSDVTVARVPVNPATNEAFQYQLDGERAILELPATDGFEQYHLRYEMTLAPLAK